MLESSAGVIKCRYFGQQCRHFNHYMGRESKAKLANRFFFLVNKLANCLKTKQDRNWAMDRGPVSCLIRTLVVNNFSPFRQDTFFTIVNNKI